jgi:cobalt-zinc-cadmium efflux system protein
MPHDHHHHIDADVGDRRVFNAIAVNVGLTAVQIVDGVISGSIALIADALHNFSDAVSLIAAFAARNPGRQVSGRT